MLMHSKQEHASSRTKMVLPKQMGRDPSPRLRFFLFPKRYECVCSFLRKTFLTRSHDSEASHLFSFFFSLYCLYFNLRVRPTFPRFCFRQLPSFGAEMRSSHATQHDLARLPLVTAKKTQARKKKSVTRLPSLRLSLIHI